MSRLLSTPCIGICSSGMGDDVCRGCKRFAYEVIDWNAYTEQERQLIKERLDNFLIKIITLKLQLVDLKRLTFMLNEEHIAFVQAQSPYLWIYDLLKVRSQQEIDPQAWGFRVHQDHQHLSIQSLHESIEEEFFELSKAHYERYIAPGAVN